MTINDLFMLCFYSSIIYMYTINLIKEQKRNIFFEIKCTKSHFNLSEEKTTWIKNYDYMQNQTSYFL